MKTKKNIKIKRHKYSFYNTKKKSRSRQILAIILTIVIAAALCVVGYGLGKPLVEYFQDRRNLPANSGSAWTPPTSEAITSQVQTEGAASSQTTSEAEDIPQEKNGGAYSLPANAATSLARLNASLETAKKMGCSAVTVTMKDDIGQFMYKSSIGGIKDSDAVVGALTAKEIADAVTAAGFVPQARINTLKDHTSSAYIDNIRYMATEGWGWLDDYAESGGKPWLSPFMADTAKYLSSIVGELSAAGFKTVVLSNTVFPVFRDADYTYLTDIADESKRLNALWKVISACNAAVSSSGGELLLEMDSAELYSGSILSTTAEPAGDKTKLKTVKLLLRYKGGSGTAAFGEAKAFIGKMAALYPEQEYSVLLTEASGTASEDIKRAFVESGIEVFSE